MLSSSKECFFIKLKMKNNWGWRKIRVKKLFSYKSKGMFSLHFIVSLTRNNCFLILIDSFQKQHPGKQPGEFDSMVSPSYNSLKTLKIECRPCLSLLLRLSPAMVDICTDSKMDVQLEITFALPNYIMCTAYLMQKSKLKTVWFFFYKNYKCYE